MKIGITGGRGRLAPLIADYYRRKGRDVRVFSRSAGHGFEALESVAEADCELLIHCAWSSVPYTAESDPGLALREDLPLLRRLCDSTRAFGSRIVFLSTGAVYGNTGHEPANELDEPRPLGAYAHGKLSAERLLLECASERSLILRVGNLLGECANPSRPQGILPRLIAAATEGTHVEIWGDGTATKDYVHCYDFLEALGLLGDGSHRGVFNVVSGASASLRELISLVELQTGKPIEVINRPHFDWDVTFSRISNQKLRERTGWAPKLSIADAVTRCLQVNPSQP